jgi:hypothetical protein
MKNLRDRKKKKKKNEAEEEEAEELIIVSRAVTSGVSYCSIIISHLLLSSNKISPQAGTRGSVSKGETTCRGTTTTNNKIETSAC